LEGEKDNPKQSVFFIYITCSSFRSFYCANIWNLWTVFFLWNFDFD